MLQTDHKIYGRRSDVIMEQKDKKIFQVIDFAGPYTGQVDTKELSRFGKRVEKDIGRES